MKLTKKQIAITVGAFVISAGAFLAWCAQPFSRPFDSHLWATCTDHSVRLAMVGDLEKRYKLVGMTKEQIYQLLGKPPGSDDKWGATWDMGTRPGLDDCTFSIDFDSNGKVVKVTDSEV
jgi:hypothetical protein